MQKGFIILLIIWNSSTFASGNSTHLRHFSLGCQAVIPCLLKRGDSDSFKWFYKKDEHSQKIQILFKDKKGLLHRSIYHSRRSVMQDRSLVINDFTEDDQGLYWCENCYQDNCNSEQHTVITVKKEILGEIRETFYATAGSNFTHACPGEFPKFRWTFESSTSAALRIAETGFVTSSKSIHIINVKGADAGKYTCWTSRCDGHRQNLVTINLCVITVHSSVDSSVSCAVICDVDSSNITSNNISNEDTGTQITPVLADLYGTLNCSVYSPVSSTQAPSNASNKPKGTLPGHDYLTPIIYGTSAALACLILMALLIFYFRRRLRADLFDCPTGCSDGGRVEDQTSVVYSSVIIRQPARTAKNIETYANCVYSEIKM